MSRGICRDRIHLRHIVKEEVGQPRRFVSRIFLRQEDAETHARRLAAQEIDGKSK